MAGALSQKTDEQEENKRKFISVYISYIHGRNLGMSNSMGWLELGLI